MAWRAPVGKGAMWLQSSDAGPGHSRKFPACAPASALTSADLSQVTPQVTVSWAQQLVPTICAQESWLAQPRDVQEGAAGQFCTRTSHTPRHSPPPASALT